MKIAVIGAGRVFAHYLENVFTKSFINHHEIYIFSNSYINKLDSGHSSIIKLKSFEELINVKPDCAFILTPSGLHYEHSLECLKNGINVLCEKPLTMRLDHLYSLVDLAEENDLIYSPVFQNRFNPTVVIVKQIIDNGMLGDSKIASVNLHWSREQSYYEDKWHGKWKTDGGVINQQAIHHIDCLIHLNGKIDSVISSKYNLINNLEAEDTHIALLSHANGSIGTLELTTSARPCDKSSMISILGTKGYIEIGGLALNNINCIELEDKSLEAKVKATSFSVDSAYGYSHKIIVEDFLSSIKNKVTPKVSAKSSFDTHQAIHSLYRSTETQSNWCKVSSHEQSLNLGL